MSDEAFDAVVVGAGAAGIGVAVALEDAGLGSVLVVDRHGIGESFTRWPKETCFLTPSFPTNSIGMLDLNSIAIGTSPAHSLGSEHPSGQSYASYLKAVAKHFRLDVKKGVEILGVRPRRDGFVLRTPAGKFMARNVVWAAGEFQYPNVSPFPGAELCRHSAKVAAWREWPEDDVLVIGGYESGIDAACNLAAIGKNVTVLSRNAPWDDADSDPSRSLSTYTRERIATVLRIGGQMELVPEADVVHVKAMKGQFVVTARDGRKWASSGPPVLATGFLGGHSLISDLFAEREDGYPLLTSDDESTLVPGLFLAGPSVRHDKHVFCFIYKFRQRFAVVAKAIANRLGLAAEELENYRRWGMYLDDLSCCGESCVC